MQPGLKLLGILGDHDGFPIERLAQNENLTLIASISHDAVVRFWDAHELCAARNDDVVDMECEKSQPLQADGDGDGEESEWETDDESNSVAATVTRGTSRATPAHARKRRTTESFFGGL